MQQPNTNADRSRSMVKAVSPDISGTSQLPDSGSHNIRAAAESACEFSAESGNTVAGNQSTPRGSWSLRRADRIVATTLTAIALIAMVAWFVIKSRVESGLIDIDRAGALPAVEFRVDINTASWPEISTIPGIGPHIARAIVDRRSSRGQFRSLRDLTEIDGIGEKRLRLLEQWLLPLQEPAGEPEEPASDSSAAVPRNHPPQD